MSEVTVFLVRLLAGQSLVLRAIWVRERYSAGEEGDVHDVAEFLFERVVVIQQLRDKC